MAVTKAFPIVYLVAAASPLTTLVATYDKLTGRGASNVGRCSNARMDALLAEATRTLDDVKRANLLRQAQTIVLADYGILPLHFEAAVWAFKQDLDYKPRADQYTLAFRRGQRRSSASAKGPSMTMPSPFPRKVTARRVGSRRAAGPKCLYRTRRSLTSSSSVINAASSSLVQDSTTPSS
jgi:hypothetical protein